MRRIAVIHIEPSGDAALRGLREGFLAAWNSGQYQGEAFSFESAAALFRHLPPRRWELLERLQKSEALSIPALARALGWEPAETEAHTAALVELGLIEPAGNGAFRVPFDEIKTDFQLTRAA